VEGLRASEFTFMPQLFSGRGMLTKGSHFGEWWKVQETVVALSVRSAHRSRALTRVPDHC
jgi:hypothetical protein